MIVFVTVLQWLPGWQIICLWNFSLVLIYLKCVDNFVLYLTLNYVMLCVKHLPVLEPQVLLEDPIKSAL